MNVALLRTVPVVAVLFGVSIFAPDAAGAAQTTSFVSAIGKDTNSCARTAPCRTLQRAHNQTDPGGEVQILDSGEYREALAIDRGITISGIGSNATLGAIAIVNAEAIVTLRRLLLNGTGLEGNGIQIDAAKAVHVEDCEIQNFPGAGIAFLNVNTTLFVTDTLSHDNGDGMSVRALTEGGAQVTVVNSRFLSNADDGIDFHLIEGAIAHSVAAGNGNTGIELNMGVTQIDHTSSQNNGTGVTVSQGGALGMTSSIVRRNLKSGVVVAAGSATLSDNVLERNFGCDINTSAGVAIRTYGNNVIVASCASVLTPADLQ